MSDLDLIPPYLHPKVAGIERPEYAGKLTAAMHPGERVELAVMGSFAVVNPIAQKDLAGTRGKPALLAVTPQRLIVVRPQEKGLFGTKNHQPLVASFAPSDHGNVFDAGFLKAAPSRVSVGICGPASSGMSGGWDIWLLMTEDADMGNFWAVNIRDNAISQGGVQRRPNGL